jgi:hypothetical protein
LNPLNDWLPATPGEHVDLYVEAAANPHVLTSWNPTGLGDRVTAGPEPVYRLAVAAVVDVEPQVRELLADLEVLDQLAAELGDDPLPQPAVHQHAVQEHDRFARASGAALEHRRAHAPYAHAALADAGPACGVRATARYVPGIQLRRARVAVVGRSGGRLGLDRRGARRNDDGAERSQGQSGQADSLPRDEHGAILRLRGRRLIIKVPGG